VRIVRSSRASAERTLSGILAACLKVRGGVPAYTQCPLSWEKMYWQCSYLDVRPPFKTCARAQRARLLPQHLFLTCACTFFMSTGQACSRAHDHSGSPPSPPTEPSTFWMTCCALPGSPLTRSVTMRYARSTFSARPEIVISLFWSGGKFCNRGRERTSAIQLCQANTQAPHMVRF